MEICIEALLMKSVPECLEAVSVGCDRPLEKAKRPFVPPTVQAMVLYDSIHFGLAMASVPL